MTDTLSFDDLIAGYPGAAILVTTSGDVVATNASGATLKALVQHGAEKEIPKLIEAAVERKTIVTGTISMKGTRGDVFLETSIIPFIGKDILAVLTRDVTMERNLRGALSTSRLRYKDLAEVASDFIWEVDDTETFSFVSIRSTLGFVVDDVLGHSPLDISQDNDPSSNPFFSRSELQDQPMTLKTPDGGLFDVVISCRPMEAPDGSWRGARGVCRLAQTSSTQED